MCIWTSVSIVVKKRGYRQATAWQLPWPSSAKKHTQECRRCPFQKSGSQVGREIRQNLSRPADQLPVAGQRGAAAELR
jgi:hypothetical protein